MFCSSDLCKNIIVILAIFLALYLILTNSQHNAKELFTLDSPSTTRSDEISAIYKSVYKQDITKEKLDMFLKDKNIVNNFDAESFKSRLIMERIQSIEDTVDASFTKVLGRSPTPEERRMYVRAMFSGKLNSTVALERTLSDSPENATTSDATREETQQRTLRKEDYALYKKIIDVYKEVLDRLPSTAELNFYFDKMKSDKTFDVAKLEDVLTSSREHLMLEMNQRNVVNGELEGNVTERQLELVIKSIYESVYNTEPDDVTYKFLRTKFVDMHLNEEAFMGFIKELYRLESKNNGEIQTEFPRMESKPTNSVPDFTSSATSYDKYLSSTPNTNTQLVGTSLPTKDPSIQQPSTQNIINEIKTNKSTVIAAKESSTFSSPLYNSSDRDTILDKLPSINDYMNENKSSPQNDLEERKSFTVYTKNNNDFITDADIQQTIRDGDKQMFPVSLQKNQNVFVKERESRDNDLQTFRRQQSSYVNEKDLVLNPEFKWSVPQQRPPVCYGRNDEYNPLMTQSALIGTLLEDAKDTEVGSIMPKFTHQVHT